MEPDQEARVVRGKHQPSINRPFFRRLRRPWGFLCCNVGPFHVVIFVSPSRWRLSVVVWPGHGGVRDGRRRAARGVHAARHEAGRVVQTLGQALRPLRLRCRVPRRTGARPRVVTYGLGGAQYSWAPRFRLAVLLLLRDAFPDAICNVEGPVRGPTLIFMP